MIMWLNFLMNEMLPRGHVILRDVAECESPRRNPRKYIQLSSYNLRNHGPQTDYVFFSYNSFVVLQIIEFLFALSPEWQLQFTAM